MLKPVDPSSGRTATTARKCLDCSIKFPPKTHGLRKRCFACAVERKRVRDIELTRIWQAANPERVRENNARTYVRRRKNNPKWKVENKRRAKAWRAANAKRIKKYNATRRPLLRAAVEVRV